MADPTFALSLFTGLADKIFGIIGGSQQSKIAKAQIQAQLEATKLQIESQEKIAQEQLAFQSEVYNIEKASEFKQIISEGLDTLAAEIGISQPLVFETAPKQPFKLTPVIIGALVLVGLLVIR